MCLNITLNKKFPKSGVGYKIFSPTMQSQIYNSDHINYEIGKTYNDLHDEILSTSECCDYSTYRTGYHIFKSKDKLKSWTRNYDIIVKVRYSNITAMGKQCGDKDKLINTVVARTMTLLEEVKHVKQ